MKKLTPKQRADRAEAAAIYRRIRARKKAANKFMSKADLPRETPAQPFDRLLAGGCGCGNCPDPD